MRNFIKIIFSAVYFVTILGGTVVVNATDVETLLRDGKTTIEKGEYEKAVDYLGKRKEQGVRSQLSTKALTIDVTKV